jgi:hypothetical protein
MTVPSLVTQTNLSQDLSFEAYTERQVFEISEEIIIERAFSVKPAGLFVFNGEQWVANSYEGFAIISLLHDHEANKNLCNRLIAIQDEILNTMKNNSVFYKLPPESFHQTIANTLSTGRLKQFVQNADLEGQYPSFIGNAFNTIDEEVHQYPLKMLMIGLSIFENAIGILGIFENEADYDRIRFFRSGFYKDSKLKELNVKMTRPFIGHITLAYLEKQLQKEEQEQLAATVNQINRSLIKEKNYFTISSASLMRYHDLSAFHQKGNYPTIQL